MYKALKTFVGVFSMTKDSVKEIKDKRIVEDLLNAGYIVEEKPKREETKEVEKPKKKSK